MSYIYKLGYHSYEDSDYIEVAHEKKFSQDDLFVILKECFIELIMKDLDDENPWTPNENEGLEYNGQLHYHNNFSHLFLDTSELTVLLMDRGFTPIFYQEQISLFGWSKYADKNDWGKEEATLTYKMAAQIEEELKDKGVTVKRREPKEEDDGNL